MNADKRNKLIVWTNKVLTASVFILYSLLALFVLIAIGMSGYVKLFDAILVPALTFILVSAVRHIYNAPRPYDVPGAGEPIIKKESSGKSFPSRHAFSIFIIAITFIWVGTKLIMIGDGFIAFIGIGYALIAIGILEIIAGIILAVVRVKGGVHYKRDVIAGALIAGICGILAYWVL